MLTHDSLTTYVADRQQARMDAATASRTGRLLRRARGLMASGPTGSASTAAPVAPASVPKVSSPVVAHATGSATGTTAGMPAGAALRTTAPTGTPEAA